MQDLKDSDMKKTNAIYGDGKERPEVVTVIDEKGVVNTAILRSVRLVNEKVIVTEFDTVLADISFEPLKQKEGLADLRGNGFGTWRDYKKKEDE